VYFRGCVILDELEREYTKELVQRCLTKNRHSLAEHGINHINTTTTTSLAGVHNNAKTTTTTANSHLSSSTSPKDTTSNSHMSSSTSSKYITTTTATTTTGSLRRVNGIHSVDVVSGNVVFEKPNGLSPAGLCGDDHHDDNGGGGVSNGFWSKMRRSPLFLLYRSAGSSGSDGSTV
jgi:hypothetical protein